MKEFAADGDHFTLEQYTIHVEALRKYNDWSDEETGGIVGFHLMGEALDCLDPDRICDMGWEEIKGALFRHFRPRGREPLLRAQLQQCRRKETETLASYAAKLRRLGRMAYPGGLQGPHAQFALVDVFIRGQGDKTFQREAYTHNVVTLEEALALAERSEAGQRSVDVTWPTKPARPAVRTFDEQRTSQELEEGLVARIEGFLKKKTQEQADDVANAVAVKLEQKGQFSRGRDPTPQSKSVQWKGSASRESSANRNRSRSQSRDRGPFRCFKCQGYGHFAGECPSRNQYEIGPTGEARQVSTDGARRTYQKDDDPNGKGGQVRSPESSLKQVTKA